MLLLGVMGLADLGTKWSGQFQEVEGLEVHDIGPRLLLSN